MVQITLGRILFLLAPCMWHVLTFQWNVRENVFLLKTELLWPYRFTCIFIVYPKKPAWELYIHSENSRLLYIEFYASKHYTRTVAFRLRLFLWRSYPNMLCFLAETLLYEANVRHIQALNMSSLFIGKEINMWVIFLQVYCKKYIK